MQGERAFTTTNSSNIQEADRLEITYFTDPLCCWSWGFEPQWRRLRYEMDGLINWKYCMAGLLPSWKEFNDESNSVNRPIQMGPVWMHASQLTGMPMNSTIWMSDPPASSYPACIAVKSAELQSAEAAEWYLRLLREAIMLRGENIAKTEVLLKVAEHVKRDHFQSFDTERFNSDLHSEAGLEPFRKDMQQVQLSRLSRYPTLLIRFKNRNAVLITGYRPYDVLVDAIFQVAPELQMKKKQIDRAAYVSYWGDLTARELQEIEGAST